MERATQEKLFARYRRIMDTKQDEWAPSPFQCPIEEYVDPQRLRVERERLFRGSPVMVAMTADVPKALCRRTLQTWTASPCSCCVTRAAKPVSSSTPAAIAAPR